MGRRAPAKPAKQIKTGVTPEDVAEGGLKEKVTDDELIELAKRPGAEASTDTEEIAEELFILQTRKGYFNDSQPGGKRYKELRDELTSRLAQMGPRLFAHKGSKYVAVRKQAHPVEVDEEMLLVELAGKPDLLNVVMPRKVDTTAFKMAVARGDIDKEMLLRVARFGENAPFVRYIPVPD